MASELPTAAAHVFFHNAFDSPAHPATRPRAHVLPLCRDWKLQFGTLSLSAVVWELHRRQLLQATLRKSGSGGKQATNVYCTNIACQLAD